MCREREGTCVYEKGDMRAYSSPPGRLRLVHGDAGGRERSWEFSAKDFATQVECAEDLCSLPQNTGCYGRCIASPPIPKIFDLRTQRLYFTVPGYDREVTLFAYDVDTASMTRILEDHSSDMAASLLSPGRRYLAYLVAYHGSACEDFTRLRVFDLKEGRHLYFPGDDDPWKRVHQSRIISSDSPPRWASDDEIELRRREWTVEACNRGDHPEDDRVSTVRINIPPTEATPTRR